MKQSLILNLHGQALASTPNTLWPLIRENRHAEISALVIDSEASLRDDWAFFAAPIQIPRIRVISG